MGFADKFSLKGKKAVITGGGRGIGAQLAFDMAQMGADIALVDLIEEDMKATSEKIKSYGVDAIWVKCDVTDESQVKSMAEEIVAKFGTIDILVNNAGICKNIYAHEMSYADWMKVVDVDLNSVFLVSKYVSPVMIMQKSGAIINTASMSGHIVNYPQPQSSYNAAKAGVIMLTKSLAMELAPYNIRVNSISPGYIATPLTEASKAEYKEWWYKNSVVVPRLGKPEELSGAVVYLASEAATFTTGSDIVIDGGYSIV